MNRPFLSLVAPVFNESALIKDVICDWAKSLEKGIDLELWSSYEIILCDDASTDSTVNIIQDMMHQLPNLILLRNTVNRGAGIALKKTIRATRGDYVVLIDSDGQFDSEQICDMFMNLKDQYDAVFGYRKKADRKLHILFSYLSTKYGNFMMKTRAKDFNCQFKLVPGEVLRALPLRATRMNYSGEITAMLSQTNLSIKWIQVNHRERSQGKSNTRLVRDGIARFLFLTYLGLEYYLIVKKKSVDAIGNWYQESKK